MRALLAFVAGLGVASLTLGALALAGAAAAQSSCFESQRAFSAWRAEDPDVAVDASLVPSCTSEGRTVQAALGVVYVGILLATGAGAATAWRHRAAGPSAPAH